jgi:dihydropteroate synthase
MTIEDFNEWLSNPKRRTLVMGVLNVTPDSFSDGGRYASVDAAVAHAEAMAAAGADLIDIGGESTRPGAQIVAARTQIERVEPVLRRIRSLPVVLSIDTTNVETALAALDAGATVVNDTSAGLDDSSMLPLVARHQVPVILMHMQGRPATMQDRPVYGDVVAEVLAFLKSRVDAARSVGVLEEKILLDPGIGFGKTLEHNLTLLRRQSELLSLGRPLVIGTSRKKFIGTITGVEEPARRLSGSLAATAWAVANGAGIVRVHDVEANVQVVRMIEAISGKTR